MYLQAKFGVVAALLAGILSALGVMLASGYETHPSESEMREAPERERDRFASLDTTVCGLVPEVTTERTQSRVLSRASTRRLRSSLHFRSAARIQTYGPDSSATRKVDCSSGCLIRVPTDSRKSVPNIS
jgi:hypothetical protein